MPQVEPLKLGPYYTRGIRFRETALVIQRAQPKSLLNVGCQYGYLESVLPDDVRVLSIDINPTVLVTARAVNAGKPNREFIHLDLFDLPHTVPLESFDAVVMSEVTEHLEDDLGALGIARDCLRPGGTLFLTVPNLTRFPNRLRAVFGRKPQYMTPNHLREYTIESGWDLVDRADFQRQEMIGLDFRLPRDNLVRRIVPLDFPVRRWLAHRWPRIATYLLYICRKPAAVSHQ